jgi:hypothetical protein
VFVGHETVGYGFFGLMALFRSRCRRRANARAPDPAAAHHDRHHRVMQSKAYETWFDSYYIRKWRLPADGEAASGRALVETSLGREESLSEDELAKVLDLLGGSLPAYGPRPFETLVGEFEPNPYQFVGPLEEAPPLAPARYLLLTHWDSPEKASKWVDSSELGSLAEFGELASRVFIPLYHQQGERNYLSHDGMHRECVRQK